MLSCRNECHQTRGFLSNTWKQTHIALLRATCWANLVPTLHPLDLSKYFTAHWRVVHAAFVHSAWAHPSLLQQNARWISRCSIWAVMIKRKGSKVKSVGFFLQRWNLVAMLFVLCSGALCYCVTYTVGGTGCYELHHTRSSDSLVVHLYRRSPSYWQTQRSFLFILVFLAHCIVGFFCVVADCFRAFFCR